MEPNRTVPDTAERSGPGQRSGPAEPRQRWRVTYRRRADAPPMPQRDRLATWEAALAASGLPIVGLEGPAPRPRIVHGAPLGTAVAAEREVFDIVLLERLPVADVRTRLAASMPPGHELVDVHDVWLGERPLSGRVVAADYRVEVRGDTADRAALVGASARLLEATALPRTREKGDTRIAYDLRPLVAGVEVLPPAADGTLITLRIRTRFDPERGVGRPEEVIAALSDLVGRTFEPMSLVRERLVLDGEG